MMRTMRASAKWIMGAVAISFVGWMVFDVGMDVGGRGGGGVSDVVARVNGTKIGYQTFYNSVRMAQDQQRQAGVPVNTLDEIRALEDQVLESMVQQILLNQEYARRDIRVSDSELRAAMQSQPLPEMMQEPAFHTEGQFDFSKYQRYLLTAGNEFQLAVESRFREELPRIKLFQRLISDIYIPDAQLWQLYQDENDSVSVRMMTLLPQAVIDDDEVETTEDVINAYYEDNQEDYRRAATAYLSYVTTSRVPNATDSSAALDRAQSILEELRDGADFAEMAARESADSVSRMNGGDLGEVTRGQHISIFADAAMALEPEEISEPVLTTFGYHIIQLQSKSGDTYQASHILIPVELDGDHLSEVESRGDSLDLYGAEQADPSVLDSVAASMTLQLTAADPLVEGQRLRVGFDLVPDVGVWAFEALEGETSHVIENESAFYLFRLDSLVPEGVAPLEEVRGRVTFEATLELKWAQTEELAAAVYEDLESGAPWEEVADRHGLRSTELLPFTRLVPNPALFNAPGVVGAAFGRELDQHSGPIYSDQAIFFIQPISRQLADSAAFAAEIEAYRERALLAARQSRVQMALAAIRERGEVDDMRREVAQALRDVPQDLFPGGPLGF